SSDVCSSDLNFITVVKYKSRSEKCGPIVGSFVTFPKIQSNGNANQCRNRCNGIASMVPSVCFKRGTIRQFCFFHNQLKRHFLPYNERNKHKKRPIFWGVVWRSNIYNAFVGNDGCRCY